MNKKKIGKYLVDDEGFTNVYVDSCCLNSGQHEKQVDSALIGDQEITRNISIKYFYIVV